MRADMAKVIVERPRHKGWASNKPKGYRRRLTRWGEDGPPLREGMRACWDRTKALNEHLGPLRRYLDQQVGRPWDQVFAEICRHIDRNSAVQDHVRDHVEQYVVRHVVLVDGVPCNGEGDWHHGRPLDRLGYRPWYVCPRTGLLRRVRVGSRKRRRKKKREVPYFPVGPLRQCRFFEVGWHLVTLEPLPPPGRRERSAARDVLLRVPVAGLTPEDARRHYGTEAYAAGLRRLGKKELRRYPVPVEWWDFRG